MTTQVKARPRETKPNLDFRATTRRLREELDKLERELELASALRLEFAESREPADDAQDAEIRDLDAQRVDALSARLRAVDEALERLTNGSYGLCQTCDSDIEGRRLEVDPAAATCLDCQKIEEGELVTPSM